MEENQGNIFADCLEEWETVKFELITQIAENCIGEEGHPLDVVYRFLEDLLKSSDANVEIRNTKIDICKDVMLKWLSTAVGMLQDGKYE